VINLKNRNKTKVAIVNSFFKKLFKSDTSEPTLEFGRFTDFYKDKTKYDAWDQALAAHEKKDFYTSIRRFFEYLQDDHEHNILIKEESEEKLKFNICQGSKLISGFINQDGFFAEAKIAKCESISVGALRSLLEENYHLRYSSYALDSDNVLTLVLHTDYIDASPYKLYYGLKEVATRSDRKDDVLVKKFSELSPINNGIIYEIPAQEKEIKYTFLTERVQQTITKINEEKERLHDHPGLASFCILSTAFLVDYFLKPESMLMEYIENIQKIFFHNNTLSPEQKNTTMVKELKKITQLSKTDVIAEMYNTKSTFGSLVIGNHIRLREMIENDMKHFAWYIQNGFKDYALYIPKYIAGLILYTYAMPLPDKRLLHLLLRVLENDFFVSLGYTSLIIKDGKIDHKYIKNNITEIIAECSTTYEPFVLNFEAINFNNIYDFAQTYMNQLYDLQIKKI
jgi:hypothetical protein